VYTKHNYTTLYNYTALFYDLHLKSNGERNKTDQTKICALLEFQWNTVNISAVRIIIVLSTCVQGIIFEIKEREAERYITKMAS